ncbi:MAG: glycoside hydrolase 5 family protein [Gaiellaceae bacterium]
MKLLRSLLAALALASPFVSRSGTHLTLAGRPFRFGGANIEWLGLAGYGPADPAGPHRPSHFEIDDALATAQQLGATVVRSQTIGDSVGCAACIEPALGQFDASAFEPIDYALARARARGIRTIGTIVGDDAQAGGSGCVYLGWRGIAVPNCSLVHMDPFWTDPNVIGDVEQHIAAVLNHVNVYTHVAYKNDPTILGWDLMNGGGSPPAWTQTIANYVRSIDTHHLILSDASNARLRNVDACVSFVYPHWGEPLATVLPKIATCRRAGKPFLAYEYGWDRTNFPTVAALRAFLARLHGDPEVAGDAFWALEAHADGHGWLPIPADVRSLPAAAQVESGEWWALYYPGIPTLVNTAADMTARAETIRAHDYAMRGVRVPPHPLPPAPAVTSTAGGTLVWQGSAGAARYRVERGPTIRGPWRDTCATCAGRSGWYRVVPVNLDGRAGSASRAVHVP